MRQSAEALCGVNKEESGKSWYSRSMLKFDYESGRYSIHTLLQMYGQESAKIIYRYGNPAIACRLFYKTGRRVRYQFAWQRTEWFNSLEVEQDNIRAALSFFLSNAEDSSLLFSLIIDLC